MREHSYVKMKCVRGIMSHPVVTVDSEANVQDAAQIMSEKKIGSVAVLTDGELVGIFTERDISTKIVAENRDASKTKVGQVMHSPVVTAEPETTIYEASKIMSDAGFRRLPIVEGEKLVGIVTQTDIEMALRAISIDELKTKVHELEIFNKMAIGRELKMAELKKRITEIEGEGEA